MRKFLADIQLKSIIKNFESSKNKQFLTWTNIQKIALVLNSKENINKSQIDQFIVKLQKYVEVYYVEDQAKAPTYADWQSVLKHDLNFLHLPKSTLLNKWHEKQFDLVINACNEDDAVAQSIAAALQANFKCATSEKVKDSNLVIKRSVNNKTIDYLEELVKYLKMIKN